MVCLCVLRIFLEEISLQRYSPLQNYRNGEAESLVFVRDVQKTFEIKR